ncbi:MAG: Na(+)-translocating NADH-quinone reductase subunit C [Halomonadaceae bacterium]|nr:MAG: Na(+)-translocating NADH-quinone reductase subunit C [Halomonadaceae bacterium]
MAQSKDTVRRTLVVALLLSVAFSVIVSTAAVSLRPLQQANEQLSIRSNMLAAAGMLTPGATDDEVRAAFDEFEVLLVEMGTGEIVGPERVNAPSAADFDDRRAARNPELSRSLDNDPAGINRQVKFAKAYVLRDGDSIERIVLPVHGYGLWSTMYGFLALEGDANTVIGLGFYEHAETPGLGGEIDNPRWRAQWPGKKVYEDEDKTEPRLRVVQGGGPSEYHDVDGLSGATLTSRGVSNMVKFWLGGQGYAPFLEKVRQGDI